MNNDYYVYLHRRASDGLPFYIGKGRRYRANDKNNRNKWWNKVFNKHGLIVEFMHTGLSEDDSKLLEVMEINNKRALGWGLVNISLGGDGNHGWAPSEETRNKISAKAKGRIPSEAARAKMSISQKGRKHSELTKSKISEANKSRSTELNREIGIKRRDPEKFTFIDVKPDGHGFVIATRREMIEVYGLNASKVSDLISGNRTHHKGWVIYRNS